MRKLKTFLKQEEMSYLVNRNIILISSQIFNEKECLKIFLLFLPAPITISYSQSAVLLVGKFRNFHLSCFSFLRKRTMGTQACLHIDIFEKKKYAFSNATRTPYIL